MFRYKLGSVVFNNVNVSGQHFDGSGEVKVTVTSGATSTLKHWVMVYPQSSTTVRQACPLTVGLICASGVFATTDPL